MSENNDTKIIYHFHNLNIYQCKSVDCMEDKIPKFFCRVCSLRNIDATDHLINHYEFITEFNTSIIKINTDSEYTKCIVHDLLVDNLNKIYLSFLNKSCNIPDKIINQILDCDCIVKDAFISTFQRVYDNFVNKIDDSINSYNKKLGDIKNINYGEKEVLSEIRRDLEIYSNELEKPISLKSELDSICIMARSKLSKLKIKDFEKKEFKFVLHSYSLFWNNGSQIFKTSGATEGKIYEIFLSKAIIGGPFLCIIKINKISSVNFVNATGQMSIGLLKAIHNNKKDKFDENTFFTRSLLISSNGYLHNKGSMSGSKKIINTSWKENDLLILKRDSRNMVFFGMKQEENCVEISKSMKGKVQIIMSFNATNCREDVFEIVHLEYN